MSELAAILAHEITIAPHRGGNKKLTLPATMFRLKFKHYDLQEFAMTEAVLDIKQWGNNLGVRLPAAVAREAHLHVDQRVRISVRDGQVVITPVVNTQLTLAQRLASFDPARHGGEAMTTDQAVGAERW